MRFPKTAKELIAALILVYAACGEPVSVEEQPGPEARFAKGGVDPACDTKDLPVREYFVSRTDRQLVSELLKDLQASCGEADAATSAQIAFSIWTAVQSARESSSRADAAARAGYGAEIVYRVLEVTDGFFRCLSLGPPDTCRSDVVDVDPGTGQGRLPTVAELAMALAPGGTYAVKGLDADDAPAFALGEADHTDRWGVEPHVAGTDWSSYLPEVYPGVHAALIWGFHHDGTGGLPGETPLPGQLGYDVSVLPWFVQTAYLTPLAVGQCKLAWDPSMHARVAHGFSILQEARAPTYCAPGGDPLAGASWPRDLARWASRLFPLWPQELHASLLASGAGMARTFSPFFGYELYPDGVIHYLTQPGDARAFTYDGTNQPDPDQIICRADIGGVSPPVSCGSPGSGIQVTWTTQPPAGSPPGTLGSLLEGAGTVQLTAQDNNGSKVELYGLDQDGNRVQDPALPCDSQDGCTSVEFLGLTLNKPGGYRLCATVTGTYGLDFPQTCSSGFHIKF